MGKVQSAKLVQSVIQADVMVQLVIHHWIVIMMAFANCQEEFLWLAFVDQTFGKRDEVASRLQGYAYIALQRIYQHSD